jgi:hypothetical protein
MLTDPFFVVVLMDTLRNHMFVTQRDACLNSVVLVRNRTIPTERPQPEGSANFS